MKIADRLVEAVFLRRKNRFSCLVELQGSKETVYLPNSGRLDSVLLPGQEVFLTEKVASSRRTKYDLVMISLNGTLVSVDSRVPGELIFQALHNKSLPQFSDYLFIRREVAFGSSRLDFLLSRRAVQCFLEVKSVTLVRGNSAAFPDAPTARGRRHVETLVHAKKEGYQAAIIFVIQREDADAFSTNDVVDADFGRALRAAHLKGVDVYAYRCRVGLEEIELAEQLPVYL